MFLVLLPGYFCQAVAKTFFILNQWFLENFFVQEVGIRVCVPTLRLLKIIHVK